MPHTTINPATAFETADEGYDGVPFPRPPREFTRPSFLPDSDDGGMDPGQALRNDGLNAPRPPTLGGRLRESGIQAAETIIAGGAAGAAAASQSFAESRTWNALRGGEDWLDRTLRIPRRPQGLGPPPDEVPPPQIIGRPSEVEPCWRERGRGRRRWSAKRRKTSSSLPLAAAGGGRSLRGLRHGGGGGGKRSGGGNRGGGGRGSFGIARRGSAGGGRDRRSGGGRLGRCRSRRGAGGHRLGHRGRTQRCLAHDGLGRRHGRRHGLRRLAGQPRNGCPDTESNAGVWSAVDHLVFQVQELRQPAAAPRSSASTVQRKSPRHSPSNAQGNGSWPGPPGAPGRRSQHPLA